MSEETSEERDARWKSEERIRWAKDEEAWRTYSKLKPIEKSHDKQGKETRYAFRDWIKETETERREKTTVFRIGDDGEVRHRYVITNKKQKFLAVNGPLAGQKLVDDRKDYVLFNRSSGDWTEDKTPKCVLVHRPSLKP